MIAWLYRIDISQEWQRCQNGQLSLADLSRTIANKLKDLNPNPQHNYKPQEDEDLKEIIAHLEEIADFGLDVDEFDDVIDRLYDWGDLRYDWGNLRVSDCLITNLCWIGTRVNHPRLSAAGSRPTQATHTSLDSTFQAGRTPISSAENGFPM